MLLLFDPAASEPALIASAMLPRRGGSGQISKDLCAATLRRLGLLIQPRRLSTDEELEVFQRRAERERTAIWIPVLERRRAVGALCLRTSRTDLLETEQIDRLAALLESALPALHRVMLRERLEQAGTPMGVIGMSAAFLQFEARLRMAGWFSQGSVLITGERGSGKELAAWAIHLWSRRRHRPMIPVLASAMNEEMLATELFGHERHAFTGAATDRAGKFLAADGGTVFLDEVGDIPRPIQAAILRVLETGELARVGSDRTVRVDARVLAATNRDLQRLVEEKRFRSDLHDRLSLFEVRVPPLRERRDDIPCLVRYFMTRGCNHSWRLSVFEQEGLCRHCHAEAPVPCVTPGFMAGLQSYDWPGNVRQLKHLIVQLTALYPDEVLDVRHLPDFIRQPAERKMASTRGASPFPPLDAAIRSHIEAGLDLAGFNQSHAARLLDLPLSTLRSKMKKLGIPVRP
ncbi:MAG TPA: sigma-54 dependent transcriptional regulator [Thermoanaerobaculia bacterium]